MLWRLDVTGKIIVSQPLLVLDLENRRGIEHEPSYVQEETPDYSKLARVKLMRLIQVSIIELN